MRCAPRRVHRLQPRPQQPSAHGRRGLFHVADRDAQMQIGRRQPDKAFVFRGAAGTTGAGAEPHRLVRLEAAIKDAVQNHQVNGHGLNGLRRGRAGVMRREAVHQQPPPRAGLETASVHAQRVEGCETRGRTRHVAVRRAVLHGKQASTAPRANLERVHCACASASSKPACVESPSGGYPSSRAASSPYSAAMFVG